MCPDVAQGSAKITVKSRDFRVLSIDAATANPYHRAAWKISVIDQLSGHSAAW